MNIDIKPFVSRFSNILKKKDKIKKYNEIRSKKMKVLLKTVKVENCPEEKIENLIGNKCFVKDINRYRTSTVTIVNDINKMVVKKVNYEHEFEEVNPLEEIKFLRKITKHENTVNILNCFKTEKDYYIFIELVGDGSTLADLINTGGKHLTQRYTEATLHRAFIQCVKALKFLHSKNFIHREVILENILVKNWNSFDIVLTNFDWSRGRTMKIKPPYESPEGLYGNKCDYKSDIYSLGIGFYILFNNGYEYGRINNTRVQLLGNLYVSYSARDLLKRMLCVSPKDRINYKQILKHKWVISLNNEKYYRYQRFDLCRRNREAIEEQKEQQRETELEFEIMKRNKKRREEEADMSERDIIFLQKKKKSRVKMYGKTNLNRNFQIVSLI